MRRKRSTSRRYRGSRGSGIGVLVPVLVVLCIVAAGVLYFINNNMTYTSDGAFFLPTKSEEKGKEQSQGIETNLIIEAPSEEEKVSSLPSSEKKDEAKSGNRSLFVPIGTVKSEELFAAVLGGVPNGVTTLVLEVKAEDGTLAFASDSPLAKEAEVSGDDDVLNSVIAKSREEGYKVALYMSCFMDNEAARKNQAYSVRTENKIIWLDGNNVRWLSAYSDAAQKYLLSVIEKLKSFSPDEIVLSNISFPVAGKTELVFYEKEFGTKSDMLKSFIDDAVKAAGGVALSAVYDNYNDAYLSKSGQDAGLFKQFKTVYAKYNSDKYSDSFDAAVSLFGEGEARLVPITKEPLEGEFLLKK